MSNFRESQVPINKKNKKAHIEKVSRKEMSEHSIIALKHLSLTASSHQEIFQNQNIAGLLIYLRKIT